jgi:hypothetical protein
LVKLLDDPGEEEPEPEGHDLMDFLEQYGVIERRAFHYFVVFFLIVF